MQIEDVAGISLAARWAAQQQRHLSIGDRLFRQVIVDDNGMHAVVAEEFAHRAAREWRQILHWRRIGGGGCNDDRIVERALLLEHLHELRDGRPLLADRDVDAIEFDLLIRLRIKRLLIEDGVERDCGLAGLAVADDQLALTASDRNQGINRLQPGRHRLMPRLARDDTGCLHVDTGALVRLDRTFPVDGVAEGVDYATKETFADRYVHDRAGTLDRLAFLNLPVVAENDDTDVVYFEVERHAAHTVLELDHLAGLNIVEAVDAGDAVADGEHLSDLRDFGFLAEVLDLLFQDGGNFCGADIHQRASFIANLIELSLVRSELSTMRLPTFTISPPMMAGSILTSRPMSLPLVTDLSALLRASRCVSLSFSATVT